ncbi:MAG: VOC family protein [Acidimicrobiia bacterium]|nr:VOC family protein [Acidimicrobiia bacterium]
MKQQVYLTSLGVSDAPASLRFYCDGLGFELVADLGTMVFGQAATRWPWGSSPTIDGNGHRGRVAPRQHVGWIPGDFMDPDRHGREVASGGGAFDESGRALVR